MSQFTLVLPVILRAVQPDTDLPSTIQRQTGISDTDIHTMMYLLSTESSKALFIFDGLDEYNLDRNKEITDIMAKREFSRSTCVITTRPEAVPKVKDWAHAVYQQAELRGFSKENIKKFIEKFFGYKEEKEYAEQLFSLIYPTSNYEEDMNVNYLGEIEELQKLAGNPGRLGMLCSIYSYNQEIITHTAKLYEEFIIIILSKWEKKQSRKQSPKCQILGKYEELLYQFGRLAYKQEDNGDLKLTFTIKNLEECISPEFFSCGFMYKSHPLHRFEDCMVGFIHKSVQEYLAAFYISQDQTGQAMDRLLKDFISMNRFANIAPVVKFAIYCRFSEKQIQNIIEYTIENAENKAAIMFGLIKLLEHYTLPFHHEPFFLEPSYDYSCFVQLPTCMICTELSESMFRSRWREIRQSDDQKSWMLTWPLGISNVTIEDHIPHNEASWVPGDDGIYIGYLHRWPLVIDGESQSIEKIQLITNGNIHINNVCSNVTKLDLYNSRLHGQAKWLNSLLLNVPNCKELNVASCGLSDEDIHELCEERNESNFNLEILNVENNDVITEGPEAMVRLVRDCPYLRKLYLTSDNVTKTQYDNLVMGLIDMIEYGLVLHIDEHYTAPQNDTDSSEGYLTPLDIDGDYTECLKWI